MSIPTSFGRFIADIGTIEPPIQPDLIGPIEGTNLIGFPVHALLKYNSAISMWNAAKSVGITSSLSNAFSSKSITDRAKGRYGAFALRGPLGDIAYNLGRLRSPISFSNQMFDRLAANPAGGRITQAKTALSTFLSTEPGSSRFERFRYSKEGEAAYLKNMRPGFFENRIMGKNVFDKALISAYGSDLSTIRKDVYNNLLKGRAPKLTGAREAEIRSQLSKRNWSVWNTIRGRDANGIKMPRSELLKEHPGNTGKNIRFWSRPSRKEIRDYNKVYTALERSLQERAGTIDIVNSTLGISEGSIASTQNVGNAIGNYGKLAARGRSQVTGVIPANAQEALSTTAANITSRLRKARLAKVLGGTVVGVSLGAEALKFAIHQATALPARLAESSRDFLRYDFGSGEMLQSSAMATERQRALQAIQNAQMNARYLMGSEAAMYHN
jgi:hypothetical protein